MLLSQWANGGGGLQSPTSQHGDHQNRRTRQGLVKCFIIVTHSHKYTHKSIWVGGIVCQKIAIHKAIILSHGHFVFSAGGGGLVFKTTHEVEDSADEVEDSLGGGGLCTWQRSQVLKWKRLLFALHLCLHSLNCVLFVNSTFICLISWCLATLLSFDTSTVH